MDYSAQHYHFVTGRLAEPSVRSVVESLANRLGFRFSIDVLPITVAALMNARWLLRHLVVPAEATVVYLPGYLKSELAEIQAHVAIPVQCGPKNILDLPSDFGSANNRNDAYGAFDIEILAEINHADRLTVEQVIATATQLHRDGADVIDLGCSPDNCWNEVGIAVAELRARGFRVSIDSFNHMEVEPACRAGAELVLSVNSSNRHLATTWNAEVVAIPDSPTEMEGLEETLEYLDKHNVRFRADPIIEPIGLGFSQSLVRYAEMRRKYPELELMMGIGNITELTDGDSAAINTILLGFCQELEIRSVLTTQVINWARNCVRECDLARRLVRFAVQQQVPPKHLEPDLVLLRSSSITEISPAAIEQLRSQIRDNNFRIFASSGRIHAIAAGEYFEGADPFEVMQQVFDSPIGSKIDPSHAFYLGFEMCKALHAITLSKQYEQDEALNWGYLTRTEKHWRLKPSTNRPSSLP